MIRPVTFICFLLAAGSGLYLYQSKHRVQLLDRQIEDTVHATDKLREQTRVLHAEWTLLNDPQRLQALADQFLTLKTVTPGQFTSMADLPNRLPAVQIPAPAPPPELEPEAVPVAEAPEPQQAPASAEPAKPAAVAASSPSKPVDVAVASPPPPKPVAAAPTPPAGRSVETASAAPAPRPPEREPPKPPAVVAAEIVQPRPAPYVPRPIVAAEVTTRPMVPVSAPVPFTGSALGMARSSVPLPQPIPVSSPWQGRQGGGG